MPTRWTSHLTMRSGPTPLGGRVRGALPPLGMTAGAPTRLRSLPSDTAERIVARLAESADAINAPPSDTDGVVVAPVRFISADLVPGYWLDLGNEAVLKSAVKLFESRPVFPNHYCEPSRWVGLITDAAWDDTPLGVNRVPGVSGHVALEPVGESARVICRGVQLRSLDRWSLGFSADYAASHEDMATWDEFDWWRKLGTPAPDGTLYRLVVESVNDVYEVSVVDVGAVESARTTDSPDKRLAALMPEHVTTNCRRAGGLFVAV